MVGVWVWFLKKKKNREKTRTRGAEEIKAKTTLTRKAFSILKLDISDKRANTGRFTLCKMHKWHYWMGRGVGVGANGDRSIQTDWPATVGAGLHTLTSAVGSCARLYFRA
ncbi:Myosin-16 [Trichinella pseudospiralis]